MKKLNHLFLLLSLAGSVLFSACDGIRGEGVLVSEEIELDPVNAFDLNINANVYVSQGEEQKVVIAGQPNILDNITRSVKSGTWAIDFKENVWNMKTVNIYLTVKELQHAHIDGSGYVMSETLLSYPDPMSFKIKGSGKMDIQAKSPQVTAYIDGSGNIDLRATAALVNSKIEGSGKITLQGEADELVADIDGSGKILAYNMPVRKTSASILGSGNIETEVSESLEVTVDGSGNVYFTGNASIDKMDISGTGGIKKED